MRRNGAKPSTTGQATRQLSWGVLHRKSPPETREGLRGTGLRQQDRFKVSPQGGDVHDYLPNVNEQEDRCSA